MRFPALSQSLVLLSLVAAPALAETSQVKFDLPTTSKVAGVELAAGTYKVEWSGTGADVQATFLKGKKVVLTATAKLDTLDKPVDRDQAVLLQEKDGSYQLKKLQFKGKTAALNLEGAVSVASAPAKTSESATKTK